MSDSGDDIYARWMAKRTPKRTVRVRVERKPEPEPVPEPPKRTDPPGCLTCGKNSRDALNRSTTF